MKNLNWGKIFHEQDIRNLLGKPTDISKIKNPSNASFSETSFNLYKETLLVSTIASNIILSGDKTKAYFDIRQGVEAGLIIRITKIMKSVLALLCDRVSNHGDSILALNQCILESSINLKFFCENAEKKDFDDFIKSSLKPEKELFETVKKNIEIRGETLPIETRIINSIKHVFKSSEISGIDDLKTIPRRKDYRSMLRLMNMESSYSMLQGVPSHAIHGDWVDILKHHIEEIEKSNFIPNTKPLVPDTRQLCPVNLMVLNSVQSYIKKYFPIGNEDIEILLARVANLIKRNKEVDEAHEEYISQRN